jgi:chromate transporter
MSSSTPDAPGFREALRYWALLGWINFGGPAGQIALMHRDLVERRRWISEGRFLHALNFCMLLPGPEAKQLAIYVGWLLHGTRGALAAGIGFVLPSVLLLWGLAWIYVTWGALPAVAALLAGIKPVVVAIVAEALVRIAGRAFRHVAHGAFALAAFVAIFALGVSFPAIVGGAALLGWGAGALLPGFAPPPPAASDAARDEALPRRRRPGLVLAAGVALWALPFALVLAFASEAPVVRDVYLFFTKAAFVTFGGAYAVLAYVAQIAVESRGWLDAPAMIDGLALAESTPGPLIVVLQFVGFLAGWSHPGALPPLAAASLAALATTWVTFLPSFLFILLGAPHVERLRGRRGLAAALAGVTAAVVGVILNLGVVFARAVLLPAGELDFFALAVALVALVALVRFHLPPVWAVVAGAAAGLLRLALAA